MTEEKGRDIVRYVNAKCKQSGALVSDREKALLQSVLVPDEDILAIAKSGAMLTLESNRSVQNLGRGILVVTNAQVLFLRHGRLGAPEVFRLPIDSIRTVSPGSGFLSADILIACIDGRTLNVVADRDGVVRVVDAINGFLVGDQTGEGNSSTSIHNSESDQDSGKDYVKVRRTRVGFGVEILPEMLDPGERVVHDVPCEFAVGVREDGHLRTMSRGGGSFLITDARLIFARPATDGGWSVEEIPLELIKAVTVDSEGALRVTGRSVAFCNISDIPAAELGPIIGYLQNRSNNRAAAIRDSRTSRSVQHSRPQVTPTSVTTAGVGTEPSTTVSESQSGGDVQPSKPQDAPTGSTSAKDGTEQRDSDRDSGESNIHNRVRCLKAAVIAGIVIVVLVAAVQIFDDGRRYSDGWQQCKASEGGSSSFYMTEEKERQGFDPCRRYSSDSWARRPTPTPVRVDYEFPTRTARPRRISSRGQTPERARSGQHVVTNEMSSH